MNISQQLGLLPYCYQLVYFEPDIAGFTHWLTKHLGLPFRPASPVGWQHAWIDGKLTTAERVIGGQIAHRYAFNLVARQIHQTRLEALGYKQVTSVGYPYLYMEDFGIPKQPRWQHSLLVMPPHSLADSSENWDELQLIERVQLLKPHFKAIVFCIHHQCIQKGYWVTNLDKFGFDYVIGSHQYDANGLARMYQIFNTFEYVTTNSWGSHILYAAYSGAKVSAIQPFFEKTTANYTRRVYINEKYRQANIEKFASFGYEAVKQDYPWFFCEPYEAALQIEWAKTQIGFENKKSLNELAKLLHWTVRGQLHALPYSLKRMLFSLRQSLNV